MKWCFQSIWIRTIDLVSSISPLVGMTEPTATLVTGSSRRADSVRIDLPFLSGLLVRSSRWALGPQCAPFSVVVSGGYHDEGSLRIKQMSETCWHLGIQYTGRCRKSRGDTLRGFGITKGNFQEHGICSIISRRSGQIMGVLKFLLSPCFFLCGQL